MRRNAIKAAVLLAVLVMLGSASAPQALAAGTHAPVNGSGSSWSFFAMKQWATDVNSQGMTVSFSPTGSASGRTDFANQVSDFGLSDIPYLGTNVPSGQTPDTSNGRPYAYLPIVGGGTAFMYNLQFGGKEITNIRLSGATLAKIFTTSTTLYWDDPAIEADNNNVSIPHVKIVPVVHAEGSGSTAQFTKYLATTFPAIWTKFNANNPASTEFFPALSNQVSQNGSDGVVNFIASAAANGAIGYDEYSYALAARVNGVPLPVAKIENQAKNFVLPTQYNDAVALTHAVINLDPTSPDYLTQTLDQVYTAPEVQAYPISSYSYMILPTGSGPPGETKMTTAKRQTLSDFMLYALCQGQAEVGGIGYTSLPLNLVQGGFTQLAKLKTADSGVDQTPAPATSCHNPTYDNTDPTKNLLALIAPVPYACDHAGAGPCVDNTGQPVSIAAGGAAAASAAAAAKGAATAKKSAATAGSGVDAEAVTAAVSGSGSAASGAAAAQASDDGSGDSSNGGGSAAGAVPVAAELAAAPSGGMNVGFGILAAVLLLVALVMPVAVSRVLSARAK